MKKNVQEFKTVSDRIASLSLNNENNKIVHYIQSTLQPILSQKKTAIYFTINKEKLKGVVVK